MCVVYLPNEMGKAKDTQSVDWPNSGRTLSNVITETVKQYSKLWRQMSQGKAEGSDYIKFYDLLINTTHMFQLIQDRVMLNIPFNSTFDKHQSFGLLTNSVGNYK